MAKKKKTNVPTAPKRSDVYTALLALSLVAILLGTLCMYGLLARYNFEQEPPPGALTTAPAVASTTVIV